MNPTLAEIESDLFSCLKRASCQPLKNVLNIESNKTLKDIICDPVYLEERLNLFIWLMCTFEPRLTPDYCDSEFYTVEIKCKKILEGLNLLGLIDLNEFNIERLINSNSKSYKDLLLILNDLNYLVQSKTYSQSCNPDDIFSLDLLTTAGQMNNLHSNEGEYFNEILSKKIQILDDPNFFKEYRSVLQLMTTSSIPSEMNRIIKVVNEQSPYFLNFPFDKNVKREELIDYFNNESSSVENKIEEIKKSFNESVLVNLDDEKKAMNKISDFKNDLKNTTNYLNDLNNFVDNLTNKPNEKDSVNQGVESNVGKCFYDLSLVYNQFQKFKTYLMDWSNFIKTHSDRDNELKTSNLISQDSYQTSINFNQQLKECSELLGQTNVNSTKAIKLNTNANETVVDQLLML